MIRNEIKQLEDERSDAEAALLEAKSEMAHLKRKIAKKESELEEAKLVETFALLDVVQAILDRFALCWREIRVLSETLRGECTDPAYLQWVIQRHHGLLHL